jgi:iron complex outermembrane recepter protein
MRLGIAPQAPASGSPRGRPARHSDGIASKAAEGDMRQWFLGAAVALTGAAAVAGAQAATSPAPQTSSEATGLPEVVVTAQRREETAQHVGIALTVLSGQQLADRGISNVNQLQYQTPSLEVTPAFGGGQPNYRLRGVGFDDYASNNASPVGVYVDDVAFPFPIETQGLVFDVARVEVLRGPQGTLYGRNTTGGAINFITNRPTSTFSAGITGEYGNYNYGKVEGYVSGPVLQNLDFRLSGVTEQGGAFQHNRTTGEALGDADRYAFRSQLAAHADKLDVLIEAYVNRDKSDGQGLYLFEPETTATGVVPADGDPYHTGWGSASPLFTSVTGIAGGAKPFKDNTGDGGDIDIQYDLGFAKLTSITGYQNFARKEYNDWDASAADFAGVYFDTGANVLSQELRLASQAAGPLKWVVGAYYSKEDLHDAYIGDFAGNLGFVTVTRYRQTAETEAGFGQMEYQVTDRLKLIGGARIEHEDRKLIDYTTTTNPVIGIGVSNVDAPSAYTQGSGKLELDYQVDPSALLYVSVSRGVKSGGFSAYNTVDPSQLHPVKPEILWAYEGGFKSELFDHTVRLNGAAYYYDYTDQQVQSAIQTFAGPIGNIVNAPKSRIYGAELELQWSPLPALEIDQSVGYKRGEFVRYDGLDVVSGLAVNRNGQDEGFPKLSYNGSVAYHWDVADYRLTAATDYSYRDKLRPVLLGSAYDVHAYWLFNANLTLAPRSGPWSVGLWGHNIFNQRYDLTRNFFTADLAGKLISIAAPGAPATYGVRVSYKY